MPYINVKVAGSLTIEQKREIANDISETMLRVCGKPKPSCYIVFDEISRENWAKGEDILSDVDKKMAEQKSS
ncbi:tautomerase family protein [Arcobacter sp. FWKO B]|uniref:tautomerase family protein n=1 Tax=Arcobacter sp. FWKO B TaxID=2593672 RepID=UPI0018A3C9BE|nr:4-oxalocrotonate tautomerase family protein [Arcobacter sp. FWKO B]QOG12524.1 4-oxalocrotonate tautomerase family protein [Arcobacter sp. FWKO B]